MRKIRTFLILIILILISALCVYVYTEKKNFKESTLADNVQENISSVENEIPSDNTNENNSNLNQQEKNTPVEIHGKLSVKKTNLVDKNGDTFSLKGVSTHGIAWFPQYINKDAFLTMRDDWGINTIRIAMYSDPNAGYTIRIT